MPQTMHTITPLITSQLNHKLNFYKRKQGKPGVKKKKIQAKQSYSPFVSLYVFLIIHLAKKPNSVYSNLKMAQNLFSVAASASFCFLQSLLFFLSLFLSSFLFIHCFPFFSHFLSLLLQSPLPSDPHGWKFRPSQSNWTFRSYHWGGSRQNASWTDSDDHHHHHPPLLPLDQPSVVPLRDAAKHVLHRLDALPYDFAKEKNKKLSLEIQNNHYQFFLFCQLLLFPSPTPQSKLHRSILLIFF